MAYNRRMNDSNLRSRKDAIFRAKRDEQIRALRTKGWLVQALADKFGVRKQRISQICGASYNGRRTAKP